MRKFFCSGEDHAFKRYGAGKLSHPVEWEKMLFEMETNGVEIEFQENVFAYEPNIKGKAAGKLVIDRNSSISALRHEHQHFLEDRANDYPGIAFYLSDYKQFWGGEFRAYLVELKFAKENKDVDLARKIIQDMKRRRQEIREDWFGIEDESN